MTVGYGDVVPQTTPGTICVGVLVVVAVLYMSMPVGIIGNAFTQVWQDRDRILITRRVQQHLQKWGYTGQDIFALFFLFDVNGDGALGYQEFRKLVKHLQLDSVLSDSRILALFQSLDTNGDGGIDDHEFIKTFSPAHYHEIYNCVYDCVDEPCSPASEGPMSREISPA
eukprot:gnl/TRDRNA2_/TRDRNA2_57470_c0_seq1.p1 gnl/TRDRNA2_/TRDRNA2_57470_c0~~gnl/TRDRNA2_/TRDRNA2_57470_c0_seq1.p1  ORF type:complete len:169 (+),score=19.95 gnl/TRDRNA2_/TRDRNA2_57470_c0_seq1:2-508(+)